MRERDRIEWRRHRDEVEALERAEQERKEAPIRAAEAMLNETSRKLAEVMRERLLAKVQDPDRIPIDPSVATVRMTQQQADEFNRAEFRKFRESHPEVYWDHELIANVGRYLEKNALKIITASMIASIIDRFREAGLLPDPPAPEPEPVLEPEPEQPSAPKTYIGRDWETGGEKTFSEREINRMSSQEYKRAFQIAPTIKDLFIAMSGRREQA
jgi:hypothetical protein